MKPRRTIFVIANYLLLAFTLFQSLYLLRYTAEVVPSDESLLPLLPLALSLVFIIINCLFNLHFANKHFSNNKFSQKKRHLYITSFILFILSIVTLIIPLLKSYNQELKDDPDGGFHYFILFIIFLFLISGIIVIVKQFGIISLIRKFSNNLSNKNKINKI